MREADPPYCERCPPDSAWFPANPDESYKDSHHCCARTEPASRAPPLRSALNRSPSPVYFSHVLPPPRPPVARRQADRKENSRPAGLPRAARPPPPPRQTVRARTIPHRSEEHTSELQSHLNLVCRLLLEKKKKSHDSHDFIKKKMREDLQ